MTTIAEVIKAAIPGANEDTCDFILWNRTPYPMGKMSARSLYKSASQFHRASRSGIRLCETCDKVAAPKHWNCAQCLSWLAPPIPLPELTVSDKP